VDTMLTVIYIIGCTIAFLFCLHELDINPPESKEECYLDAVWLLLYIFLWPGILVISIVAYLIKWICVVED